MFNYLIRLMNNLKSHLNNIKKLQINLPAKASERSDNKKAYPLYNAITLGQRT